MNRITYYLTLHFLFRVALACLRFTGGIIPKLDINIIRDTQMQGYTHQFPKVYEYILYIFQ